jgi:hypothetical protein
VNILPEDNADATALREELREQKGGVHLEVGRFVASEPSLAVAAAAPVRQAGFIPPPEWTALSPAEAVAFVVRLLSRPPARRDGAAAVPQAEAERLAARLRALFSERARFFMSGGGPGGARDGAPDRAQPSPDSTRDFSLFVVDGDRAGLLWGEGED